LGLNGVGDSLLGALHQLPALIVAVLIILIFVGISRVVQRVIFDVGRVSRVDPMLQELTERLVTVAIVTFGVAVALGVMGLNAGTIAASFGVAGLVVGFALKDLLENFIAGIMILWRRPFKVLDQIRVGTNEGIVREITFRTTTLLTPDGIEVLIPNGQLLTQAVYNLTHVGTRRTTIVFKLPADADVAQARQALLTVPEHTSGVLAEPEPEVLLLAAAPDGVELHLRYWTLPGADLVQRVESSVREAALAALAPLQATAEPAPVAAGAGD
ncbi:MAG TPA: mechanosensitive ion channel family protein, partial [Thermomicrobiaceae bacterium]|nr:mechanosensitive ion channel family protein [Thermomicrobiaceae bacterium]